MTLIEKFENLERQTVKTFNTIFQSTPIVGVEGSLEVSIGEICEGDRRKIRVGDIEIRMCLVQRKNTKRKARVNYKIVAFDKKECTNCKIVKTFSEFHTHRTSKGGVRARCKKCVIEKVTAWKNKKRLTQSKI